jgi:hypothetical protein
MHSLIHETEQNTSSPTISVQKPVLSKKFPKDHLDFWTCHPFASKCPFKKEGTIPFGNPRYVHVQPCPINRLHSEIIVMIVAHTVPK